MQDFIKKINLSLGLLPFLMYFGWIFVILLVTQTYFCYQSLNGCLNGNYLLMLANWDGQHFLKIAESGYTEVYQFAFFPLFSILIFLLNLFNPFPSLINGLGLNWLSAGVGFVYLFKLLNLEFNKKNSL